MAADSSTSALNAEGGKSGAWVDIVPKPFMPAPPFYWVQDIEALGEFEVSGSCGEIVTKMGDYDDEVALASHLKRVSSPCR